MYITIKIYIIFIVINNLFVLFFVSMIITIIIFIIFIIIYQSHRPLGIFEILCFLIASGSTINISLFRRFQKPKEL